MAVEGIVWNTTGLAQLLKGVDGPVGRDLNRRAVKVESRAKTLCAVDTGRLRASITHVVDKDARGLYADVGTNVNYAPYVELGTSRMAAQPYLVPALKAAKG